MPAKTSISPMLSVRRGAKAVEFYKKAFGARALFCVDNEAGEVVAHLAVGEAEFWVADESPEHKNFSLESRGAEFRGGATVRMVLVVEDPEAFFKTALDAGAALVWPVAEQGCGWRAGRLVDPFGHHWEIGRPRK